MSEGLKRCPFCGESDADAFPDQPQSTFPFAVVCRECSAAGPSAQTGEEAETAWNHRAETPTEYDLAARLRQTAAALSGTERERDRIAAAARALLDLRREDMFRPIASLTYELAALREALDEAQASPSVTLIPGESWAHTKRPALAPDLADILATAARGGPKP